MMSVRFIVYMMFFLFFFFFSSSRRHTRLTCDWSSDGALPICGRGGELQGARVRGARCPLARGETSGRRAGRRRTRRAAQDRLRLLGTRLLVAGDGEGAPARSEERRVGKECRSRCSRHHEKKKI